MYTEFVFKENNDKTLEYLGNIHDQYIMNWIKGTRPWGTTIAPETIDVNITRGILPNGNLQESYVLKNNSEFPVFFRKTDVGIYTPFNDDYKDVEISMTQRCHTHIFCGLEAAYVMALRMNGEGPHLGLVLRRGSIVSYSTERRTTVKKRMEELSDDRGDFILHPELNELEPGESTEIIWELFWFESKADFGVKLLEFSNFPVITANQFSLFIGEKAEFDVAIRQNIEEVDIVILCNGEKAGYSVEQIGDIGRVHCEHILKQEGEYRFDVLIAGKRIYASFYASPDLGDLVRSRCRFISRKQQYNKKGAVLDGAYLIFDNQEKRMYYSHLLNDHNGGREKIAMGALIALWLQKEEDSELMESLLKYKSYLYREIYDKETGQVANDVLHNIDLHRMYNYPWMAIFQMEMFKLTRKLQFLLDANKTMHYYYVNGGVNFYAIGIPCLEIIKLLKEEKLADEAESLTKAFLKQVDVILKNSTNYPPFEVTYEQSIVAPAVSYLLQGYVLTSEEKYLTEAKKQIAILDLFNGKQPDYHLFENAIRHWDGFWFGKYANFGDTYPHYWSTLTGTDYALYTRITGDETYAASAVASLRGCLSLFKAEGRASCAMVFPETVNGKRGHYYDPWANDQDWALYYALKHETLKNIK